MRVIWNSCEYELTRRRKLTSYNWNVALQHSSFEMNSGSVFPHISAKRFAWEDVLGKANLE